MIASALRSLILAEAMGSGVEDLTSAAARRPRRWSDASTWSGDGIRREVFYFPSGGVELYGSLYRAEEPSRPLGVVACSSWGVEADRSDPLVRSVAHSMARIGGAGMVFHYPGYGDSHGELAEAGLDDLVTAVRDAVAEASRRCPGLDWALSGFMFGASVACLAQLRLGTDVMALVQPELRPEDYFRRLSRSRSPMGDGIAPPADTNDGSAPDIVYGYPLPRGIGAGSDECDAAVAEALGAFSGRGAVIRHAKPPADDPLPPSLETVEVSGSWRFGTQNSPRLAEAATAWLDGATAGASA